MTLLLTHTGGNRESIWSGCSFSLSASWSKSPVAWTPQHTSLGGCSMFGDNLKLWLSLSGQKHPLTWLLASQSKRPPKYSRSAYNWLHLWFPRALKSPSLLWAAPQPDTADKRVYSWCPCTPPPLDAALGALPGNSYCECTTQSAVYKPRRLGCKKKELCLQKLNGMFW